MRLNEHENVGRDYKRARALRNDPSPFEKKLWVYLREQAKLRGLKFRRQQPLHPFIADFASMEAKLVVELDGFSHDARLAYDKARDEKLREMGYFVLRYCNQDIGQNLEFIVEEIVNRAAKLIQNRQTDIKPRAPLPNPPREGEGKFS